MKLVRSRTAAVMVAALSTLLTGPVLAQSPGPEETSEPAQSWLYIQTAESATFDGTTLTLGNASPTVVAFTDRPERTVRPGPLTDLVAHWGDGENSFAADPPQAGLTSIVDGGLQTAVVELSEPQLDGTTLTYQVRVLEGDVPETGGQSSLVIDSGCNPYGRPGCGSPTLLSGVGS
ncbi:MAG: hypothetical protein KF809_04710 [Chloroflexi bacterium]|nr:hypothetical protein [Chloroflexota bacterium]